MAGDYCFLALNRAGGSAWQVLLSVPAGLCRVHAVKPAAQDLGDSSSSSGGVIQASAADGEEGKGEVELEVDARASSLGGDGVQTEGALAGVEGEQQKQWQDAEALGEVVGELGGAAAASGHAAAVPPAGGAATALVGAEGPQAAAEVAEASPASGQGAYPRVRAVPEVAGGAQAAADAGAVDQAAASAAGGTAASAVPKSQRVWRVEPQPEPGQLLLMVNTAKWGQLQLVWRPHVPKPAPVESAVEAAAVLAASGASIWDVGGGQGAAGEAQEEAGFVWQVTAAHTKFSEYIPGLKGIRRGTETLEAGSTATPAGNDAAAARKGAGEGSSSGAAEEVGRDGSQAAVAEGGVAAANNVSGAATAQPRAFLMVQGAVRGTLQRTGEDSGSWPPSGSSSSSSRRRGPSSSHRSSSTTSSSGSRRGAGGASSGGSGGGGGNGGLNGPGSDSGGNSSSGEGPSRSNSGTSRRRMQGNDTLRMAVVSAALAAKSANKASSSSQPIAAAAASKGSGNSSAAASAAAAALPVFFYLQDPRIGGRAVPGVGLIRGMVKTLEQLVKTVPSRGPPRTGSSSSSSSAGQQKQQRLLPSQLLQQAGGTILKLGPLPLAQVQEWLRSSSLKVAGGQVGVGAHLVRLALPKPLMSSGSVDVAAVRYLTSEGRKAAQLQQTGHGQRQQQGGGDGQGQGAQREVGGFGRHRPGPLPQRIIIKRKGGADGSDGFTAVRVGSAPSVLMSGDSSSRGASGAHSWSDMVRLAAPGGLVMGVTEGLEGMGAVGSREGPGSSSSSSIRRAPGVRGQMVPLAQRVQSHPLFSRLRPPGGAAGVSTGDDGAGAGGAFGPVASHLDSEGDAGSMVGVLPRQARDGVHATAADGGGGGGWDSTPSARDDRAVLGPAGSGGLQGSKQGVTGLGLEPRGQLQQAGSGGGVAAVSSSNDVAMAAGWTPMQSRIGFSSYSSTTTNSSSGGSGRDVGNGLGAPGAAAAANGLSEFPADSAGFSGFSVSAAADDDARAQKSVLRYSSDLVSHGELAADPFHVGDIELADQHSSSGFSFGAASDDLDHHRDHHHELHHEDDHREGCCLDVHDELPDQGVDIGHGAQVAAAAAGGGLKAQQASLALPPAMVALAPAESDASGIEDTLLFELD